MPRFSTCWSGAAHARNRFIFQIDLFSAHGPVPKTLFEIAQREKEIRYSSRTRLSTDVFRELQAIRRAVHHLRPLLPDDVRESGDWQLLDNVGCDAAITIVQLRWPGGLVDSIQQLPALALHRQQALASRTRRRGAYAVCIPPGRTARGRKMG